MSATGTAVNEDVEKMTGIMSKFWNFLIKQYFIWIMGSSNVGNILSFALLVLANREVLGSFFHINTTELIFISLPAAFFAMWVVGKILDLAKFYQKTSNVQLQRMPYFDDRFNEIKSVLAEINKRLEALEK